MADESCRTDPNTRPSVYKTAGEDAQLPRSQALSELDSSDYTKNDTKDADLALVIEAWPALSGALRVAIVALVQASPGKSR